MAIDNLIFIVAIELIVKTDSFCVFVYEKN